MAEMELSVLARQCLGQYFETKDELTQEIQAWQKQRNTGANVVNWQFTAADARIKLKTLYPIMMLASKVIFRVSNRRSRSGNNANQNS